MRHNRKKNRSIFINFFQLCFLLFCFQFLLQLCSGFALCFRGDFIIFFFLFEGWGGGGFHFKMGSGAYSPLTCNCEANWVKGNCGKCFLPTCEAAIKLFKDGSMQSNGVSINRTE